MGRTTHHISAECPGESRDWACANISKSRCREKRVKCMLFPMHLTYQTGRTEHDETWAQGGFSM